MAAANKYKYNRIDLATDAIRLVKVLKGEQLHPIQCEIFETHLHKVQGVPYEALSYVWGTTPSANRIWVDQCEVDVTENLYEALKYLRRPDEDRFLWVDAICIDQSHTAERGHQVRQMRLVFQTAYRFVAWLGAGSEEIDWLFEWMNIPDQKVLTIAHPHTLSTWKYEWLRLVSSIHGRPPPIHIHDALLDLLRGEWFYRVWIVQEAALAKSAVITCGSNEVNSRALVVMPSLLGILCVGNAQARLEVLPGVLRETSSPLGGSSQQLLTLLQKFGTSRSSDPRDIICALLGLSEDSSSELLQPDYQLTSSVQEVIQRAIAFFMMQKHDLSMETPIQLLPTWTIDGFLDSLHDLTLCVFQWATEHAQDVLLYDLIIVQIKADHCHGIQQYTTCTGTHGPPIMVAIKKANFPLFELLLRRPKINLEPRNSTGKTAMSLAVEQGNLKIVSLLLEKKADINSRDPDDRAATPIWNAAACGHLEMVRLLVERGADMELLAKDTSGGPEASVLWAAASKSHTKVVMYLLEAGVEVEIVAGATTNDLKDLVGTKILLWAATCRGHIEAVRALAILGMNLDSLCSSFWVAPIWVAASLGYADIVDLLATHGANIEARDGYYGMTPYSRAAEQNVSEVMEVLIKHSANTSAQALYCGKSALMKSLSQKLTTMELVSQWPPPQPSFTVDEYFQSGGTPMQWPFCAMLQKLLLETVVSCPSVRKAAISTNPSTTSSAASVITAGTSTPLPSFDCQAATKQPVKDINRNHPLTKDAHIAVKSSFSSLQPDKTLLLPEHSPWELYLRQSQLNEEPGTLWNSSLCTIFHECLSTIPDADKAETSEYAARIDNVYWEYYLPLDPSSQFKEDKILSSYLLHVWATFIELGKRIPPDDPTQEKLVELLKELIHLPPMEVRTWEGNDAPWKDLPTLDDTLVTAWDDLYDTGAEIPNMEGRWVNYFAFLGRPVSADVTPDWWEIPSLTLKEVLSENDKPSRLTICKTMALAEYIKHAGGAFVERVMNQPVGTKGTRLSDPDNPE